MASITIRRLDDTVKAKLRLLAARHGTSMEQEARAILKAGVGEADAPKRNLAEAIRARIEPLGGVELKLPRREPVRRRPNFEK